jgi:GTPase SAR1 family protein
MSADLEKLRKFEENRQYLITFYRQYNPDALGEVDDTLKAWAGRENELFAQLRAKYLSQEERIRKAEEDYRMVVDTLKNVYKTKIRPVEEAYKFDLFLSPFLEPADFEAKPMILLLGQYSVGKTTFIRHLLERDFPGMRIGPEPTTDRFVCVMHGREDAVIPGNALTADATKPFRALEKFGSSFLNRVEAVTCSARILESMTFIDTPGVLSGEKQRIGRQYNYPEVVEWFSERADRILLLFDAHKLDISDEFKRVIEATRGHDEKVRVVLNKSDSISPQQLLRVYGALMWSLGKVIKTPEVTRVFVGSFTDNPTNLNHENSELFKAERADLLADLFSLPRNAAVRKVNETLKRARLARLHAIIMASLREQMPSFWGKGKKQQQLLDDLPKQFKKVGQACRVPDSDFPDPIRFKEVLQSLDLSDFPKNPEKMLKKLESVLSDDVPVIMQKMRVQETDTGMLSDIGMANPFMVDVESDQFTSGGAWIISQTKKLEYDNIFKTAPLTNNKLQGSAAKEVLIGTSGLPNAILFKIWNLSDIDKDGALDSDEFAVAMYLVEDAKAGKPLPDILPPALIPPGKR